MLLNSQIAIPTRPPCQFLGFDTTAKTGKKPGAKTEHRCMGLDENQCEGSTMDKKVGH